MTKFKFDFDKTKDDLLIAVDMQVDFCTGTLKSNEAASLVPGIVDFYRNFKGKKGCTLDTHGPDYLRTQEGRLLPIEHTILGSPGWLLMNALRMTVGKDDPMFQKPTFGSEELMAYIKKRRFKRIFLCGTRTDMCVIANAILAKTADPEAEICILCDLCSGMDKQSHEAALHIMAGMQMTMVHLEAA